MSDGSYKITITAVDSTTAVMRKINASFAQQNKMFAGINATTKNFGKELKTLGKLSGFTDLHNSVKKVGEGISSAVGTVSKFATGVAAIAGAVSVAGIAKLAKDFADFNRALENNARVIGVSPQALEKVQKAASLLGIDANTTTGAMQTLGQTMEDALNGRNNDAANMFKMLGINIRDVGQFAKDPISILPELAEKIAAIPDQAGRAAAKMKVAQALFGGYAQAMMPLLDKGAKGYDELIKRVEKYANYNKASAAITESMYQSLALTNMAADSLGKSIGAALAPAITRMSEAIRPILDRMNEWVRTHKELINTKIQGFITGVTDAIKVAWPIIDKVVTNTIGWKNALVAIGAVIAASFALPIISFIIAPLKIVIQTISLVSKALYVLATNPALAAILVAIAAIGLVVYEVYQHWAEFKNMVVGIWKDLTTCWTDCWTLIKDIFTGNFGAIKDDAGKLWNDYVKYLSDIWGLLSKVWSWCWDDLKNIYNTVINPFLEKEAKGPWEAFKAFFNDLINEIPKVFKAALDDVMGIFRWFENKMPDWMKKKLGIQVSTTDEVQADDKTLAAMPAPHVAAAGSAGTPAEKDWQQKMVSQFMNQHGMTKEEAAAAVGNITAESSGRIDADNGSHYGIGQWDKTRQANFAKRYGHDIRQGSLEEQEDFYAAEMKQRGLVGKGMSYQQASDAVTEKMETPATPGSEAMKAEQAKRYRMGLSSYNGGSVTLLAQAGDAVTEKMETPATPGSKAMKAEQDKRYRMGLSSYNGGSVPLLAQAGAAGAGGKVDVHVKFDNPPKGTKTEATAKGTGLNVATSRTASPVIG